MITCHLQTIDLTLYSPFFRSMQPVIAHCHFIHPISCIELVMHSLSLIFIAQNSNRMFFLLCLTIIENPVVGITRKMDNP